MREVCSERTGVGCGSSEQLVLGGPESLGLATMNSAKFCDDFGSFLVGLKPVSTNPGPQPVRTRWRMNHSLQPHFPFQASLVGGASSV